MTTTVAVLGANGVYGRHLIPRLVDAGYAVRALVRRPQAATMARACGANVVAADIFDIDSMADALRGSDIGINLATSLPGPSGRGSYEANDRLRSEGTVNWIDACKHAGVERVIQQSIGMVNGAGGDTWSDEGTVFSDHDGSIAAQAITASLTMESHIEASGLDWIILRGGLFYGPGTGFDDSWYSMAAAGKLRLPGDGSDYVSLCHISDMARATMAALSVWPSRQKLIICDDEPAVWRDVFGYIADALGQAAPEAGGRAGFNSFRLCNKKAKSVLAWMPAYPTWREGLAR
jgi:nucleoside-diphosphate-sugar epimerase